MTETLFKSLVQPLLDYCDVALKLVEKLFYYLYILSAVKAGSTFCLVQKVCMHGVLKLF